MNLKKSLIILSFIGIIIFGFFVLNIFKTLKKFDEIQNESLKSHILEPSQLVLFNYRKFEYDTVNFKQDNFFFHFWATWCKPCLKEFDSFDKILETNNKFNVYFITEEDSITVQNFLQNSHYKNIPFYGINKENNIFNHKILPTTYYSLNDSVLKKLTGKYDWVKFFNN